MNRHLPIVLLLVVATCAVFAQVHTFKFINYDDEDYIVKNPQVAGGLGADSIHWAFTSTESAVWQPLTWLSLMSDATGEELDPGRFHVHNLVLHLLNTILLYFLLFLLTRAAWPAAAVALLFAIHPLHVESVAWVTERKDVLSVFWGLISLMAYVRFARSDSRAMYAVSILAMALGLMAKPLLVVWPGVMLLLDWWPMGRMGRMGEGGEGATSILPAMPRRPLRRLITEKIPFAVLALISSGIAYRVHLQAGALGNVETVSLGDRLANAAYSYLRYLEMTFWPQGHSILYPHPNMSGGTPLSAGQVGLAVVVLILLTALMTVWRRRRYLLMGWLLFLGALVPMIGLVPFGTHAMADRFTYVPLIGIFIMLAYGAQDLNEAWRQRRHGPGWLLPGICFALALLLILPARTLVAKWSDSISLYEYSLESGPGSPKIHYNLGLAYSKANRLDEGIEQYRIAIELQPHHDRAWNNLGFAYGIQSRFEEGEKAFLEALRQQPEKTLYLTNYAKLLAKAGRIDEAVAKRKQALGLQPDATNANNTGVLLAQQGRLEEAISYFELAMELEPGWQDPVKNLAMARQALKKAP